MGAGGGGGLIVSAAVLLAPARAPVMVALTGEGTDVVETVKVALAAPAGTVTDAGTRATEELLDSATETPPAGAGAERVSVA